MDYKKDNQKLREILAECKASLGSMLCFYELDLDKTNDIQRIVHERASKAYSKALSPIETNNGGE